MHSGSRYIIATGVSFFCIALLYFLSLILHLPFLITVAAAAMGVFFIFKWILTQLGPADTGVSSWWSFLVLVVGVYFIVTGFSDVAEQYGGWDAWGIWNFHAKYLADPVNWRKMFENSSFAHPDYPLLVPAVTGFFIRLAHKDYLESIPFVFHFCITLFIPVLIYLENLKKNPVVAAVVFFLFAFDTFYLTKGATQYADTPLAFFFLCAFVTINYAKVHRGYVALCAICLAGCAWTKNEGSILALVFILFYARTFFSRRNIGAFVAGMAIPLILMVIFKMFYATGGSVTGNFDRRALSQLFVKDRYDLIWNYFKGNVAHKYYYVQICLFIYVLLCVLEKRWPGRQFFLLLCCVGVYTMVYVLTPGGIEWLLDTSQERLMHQLMPALMYVFSQRFVRIHFSLPKEQLS